MSVEDEVEFKDLLLQTLTENGCLAKIKAQLRANVFLALEEDKKLSNQTPLLNNKVKSSLSTSEGQLMFCIVKEFLEFFNLQSTMTVFDAESYAGTYYQYDGKRKLSQQLNLNGDETVPLLQNLLQLAQHKSKLVKINLNITEEKSEAIDNSRITENSVKTESNLNEDLSDISSNSSVYSKENGENTVDNSYSHNPSLISEHKTAVNINKAFIRESQLINTQPSESNIDEENILSNGDVSSNSSVNTKENGENTTVDNSYSFNLSLMSEHEPADNFNKTFITESQLIHTQPLQSNTAKENIVSNTLSSEVYPSHIMTISDKVEEVTIPVLKDSKLSPERVKSPPKPEKFKSKNSLNSLSDLPPLNMTKPRTGKILPSLYGRDFKEKSNS